MKNQTENTQIPLSEMTLRDFFAAQAMQAMASDSAEDFTDIAELAYILANAMMEARK